MLSLRVNHIIRIIQYNIITVYKNSFPLIYDDQFRTVNIPLVIILLHTACRRTLQSFFSREKLNMRILTMKKL